MTYSYFLSADGPRKLSIESIDKSDSMPAYAQLAQIIRQRISNGTYAAGQRLPSEADLAKCFGLSAMTARQAVGVLAEEGLVTRIQGRGTFAKKIEVATSSFGLDSLRDAFSDKQHIEVRILKATIEKAHGVPKAALMLPQGNPMVVVERLISYRGLPFTLQTEYARFAPESPIVETMLDTDELTGLFFEQGHSCFKMGELRLLPTALNDIEAALLQATQGSYVFRLEHIFHDFSNQPAAFGWLIFSPEKIPMISRVGVWHV
jgi:DNA-binding GntR family transcriptional regulator